MVWIIVAILAIILAHFDKFLIGFIAFLALCCIINKYFPANKNNKSTTAAKQMQDTYLYDDDDFVTRAQRRREQERREKEERDRRQWLDDYDTQMDEDGNEHSLDYDNYCDDCDEYHQE